MRGKRQGFFQKPDSGVSYWGGAGEEIVCGCVGVWVCGWGTCVDVTILIVILILILIPQPSPIRLVDGSQLLPGQTHHIFRHFCHFWLSMPLRGVCIRGEAGKSGVARNTACHRTPKWLARRPEALRPGGSSFPAPNLLKAVFRATPLFPASPRMQTPRNGVESQKWQKCLNM